MNTTTSDAYATALEVTDASGVSWSAVFAGAAAAAALSLILVLLGFGLGFAAISPWQHEGISAEGLGFASIAWLAFTQLAAAGLGGYLAGRLRLRWSRLHGDEVFFRDTAHGFLAWAVATLVTAALLVGTVGNLVGGGVQAGAAVAAGASAGSAPGASDDAQNPYGYYVDTLFRDDRPAPTVDDAAHGVVSRIFVRSLAEGGQLSPEDHDYLVRLVAQRTNLSQAEAQARVEQVHAMAQQAVTDARQAADAARKAGIHASLWMFVALLIGAFTASFAATRGGRSRDTVTDSLAYHRPAPLR
ncbi:hypothetical protein PSm6_48170 [Pseudomonas solani]|uniref:Transmembrane protein n=1 Tax=Pseudomonas solani TaxID=2731552 RepID=A0ABM7LFQ4_9PSED|nr:hypothetical protein [Pseudomonas solani]BCD88410.1 hypothetical protein PSm6_48170 [Pseudomonas solani]